MMIYIYVCVNGDTYVVVFRGSLSVCKFEPRSYNKLALLITLPTTTTKILFRSSNF